MLLNDVYVAHTNREWFDDLSRLARAGTPGAGPLRLDEANDEHKGRELVVPHDPALRPSLAAIAWHRENVFERA